MYLNPKEFKEFNSLMKKLETGSMTAKEKKRLAELKTKKDATNQREKSNPTRKKGQNDPSWYTKYPDLMKDAANIPFNRIAGVPVTIGTDAAPADFNFPVGAVIKYIRTPGKCAGSNDAYNYQMRALWLDMHRKYRGMGSYEWADLGIIMFSILNVFSDIARAERLYGLCSLYMKRNRSYPQAVLTSLGFDVDAITGDQIADFRYQINNLINRATMLCLPKGMSALSVFASMDSNIFKDSDSSRALWYVYDTPYNVQYSAAGQSTGGSIRYVGRRTTGRAISSTKNLQTFDDVIEDLRESLDLLLSDTDVARVCSDVIAAYGSDTESLGMIQESYVVEPVRVDERLLQLHNTTICGNVGSDNLPSVITPSLSSQVQVFQEGGYIHCELATVGGQTSGAFITSSGTQYFASSTTIRKRVGDVLLDIWKDDVSSDDVVEMTRQTVHCTAKNFTVSGTTYQHKILDSFGLVVVTSIEIWDNTTTSYSGNTFPGKLALTLESDISNNNQPTGNDVFLLGKFDWHPAYTWQSSGGYYPVIDVDNYTTINDINLSRLHDSAVLSAFKIVSVVQ